MITRLFLKFLNDKLINNITPLFLSISLCIKQLLLNLHILVIFCIFNRKINLVNCMQIKRIRRILLFLLLFAYFESGYGQVPTDQDCLGAIPICQPVYHEDSSYTGSGNYTNEIDTLISCLANEDNSVWYIFTAQTSGMLSFIITPEDTLDDWDWAVYDLTNAGCADILTDPSLQISCNSYGNYTGWYNGPTGASSAMGGTTNNNGPGIANGPPWNADIPVMPGGTYALLICNWSGSTYGYTLDFSASTAVIFDDVDPYLSYFDTLVFCGSNTLNIGFSERILCNSISPSDFRLKGPLINHTINNVNGLNCSYGGNQEQYYTIEFSPPISHSGYYSLELVDSDGSVSDLCNNIAPVDSISFYVGDVLATIVNVIHSKCGLNNGSATASGTGGSGLYTYFWSTNPPQTTQTAVDLGAGKYYVTVTSGGCMAVDSIKINTTPVPVVTIIPSDTLICNDDEITLQADDGFIEYIWNNNLPGYNNYTISQAGSYFVSVVDSIGCIGISDTITIGFYPDPEIFIDPTDPVICHGEEILLTVSGAETYSWFPNSYLSDSADNSVIANPPETITYTIEGTDDKGCKGYNTVTIEVVPEPQMFLNDSAYVCTGETVRLSPGYSFSSYLWKDGTSLPYIDIMKPGTYWVEIDHEGCIANDTIILLPCSEIWVPNSFTPNGDGINDVFKAFGSGNIKEFKMIIFNRWGTKIFESKNIQIGWNGSYKGKPVPEGTYVWSIFFKPTGNYSAEILTKSGNISLLK